jgi:hypothetical protein
MHQKQPPAKIATDPLALGVGAAIGASVHAQAPSKPRAIMQGIRTLPDMQFSPSMIPWSGADALVRASEFDRRGPARFSPGR